MAKCTICKKTFNTVDEIRDEMKLHKKMHRVNCAVCDQSLYCKSKLKRHMQTIHGQGQPKTKQVETKTQGRMVTGADKPERKEAVTDANRKANVQAGTDKPGRNGAKTNALPRAGPSRDIEVTEQDMETEQQANRKRKNGDVTQDNAVKKLKLHADPKLERIYKEKERLIKSYRKSGILSTKLNIETEDATLSPGKVRQALLEEYEQRDKAFKVNISVGLILENKNTEELRYFYAEQNSAIFDNPVLIATPEDIDTTIQRLNEANVEKVLTENRPDSAWRGIAIPNVLLSLTSTDHYII